VYKIQ